MRFVKQVASKGHITVPSDVRSALVIGSGDLVEFELIGVIRRRSAMRTGPEAAPAHPTGG